MMDATPIFPVPYHPVTTGKTRDFTAKVRPLTRTDRPVKYYWIDFGLSRHYRPEERPPAETIIMGADDTVPEYKEAGKKYDPFPADVYLVGHLVLESLVEVRCNRSSGCQTALIIRAEVPQRGRPSFARQAYGPRRSLEATYHGPSSDRLQEDCYGSWSVKAECSFGQPSRVLHWHDLSGYLSHLP
jgi:hypothetical protein